MASDTKILPGPLLGPASSRAQKSSPSRVLTRNSARVLDRDIHRIGVQTRVVDIVLCHNVADLRWAEKISQRIRREYIGNRNLRVEVKSSTYSNASEMMKETERCARTSTFLAVVITAPMLQTDWHVMARILERPSNTPHAKARILTILKENVTMPAFLRVREWIDFRNSNEFETSVQELLIRLHEHYAHAGGGPSIATKTESKQIRETEPYATLRFSAKNRLTERIVSNLFSVLETPRFIFSTETACRTDEEVIDACGGYGPLPFLLQGSRLYTFEPPTQDSVFGPALSLNARHTQENFTPWFSSSERAGSAIYLLNVLFRHHAWKRGLRYDAGRNLYYFTRSKPKNVWWQMGHQPTSREVTAPHVAWIELENHAKAEVQYGWRHLAVRAEFVQVLGALFLRLEPTWHLTELDGKTSAAKQPVRPVRIVRSEEHERNGQILRSLRFWSVVLAKGHQELRINTSSSPMRARMTPLSGFNQSGIRGDQQDYDQLMLAESHDDLFIPELGPIQQESAIPHEEDISS